jgi:uncharacterized protein (DUF1810 family)
MEKQEKKHQVHNLIILDESGSMGSIRNSIINGFNELVQNIKEFEKQYSEQEHFISLISFNSESIKKLHYCDPVEKLEMIDQSRYCPNSCTPLYDAIGFAITEEQKALQSVQDYNVLVTIMTDGMENASVKYSGSDIKKMIEKLKNGNWTFTYIGTEHDIDSIANSLSINSRMKFGKNTEEIHSMFEKDRYSRSEYYRKVSRKENFQTNYFNEDENLYRFVKAQERYYPIALQEIRNGRKESHWMWFIFPQIKGLGYSSKSTFYAIHDLDEARSYLNDKTLGSRLIEISSELLRLPTNNAEAIFGYVDALKLRSCMTLFSLVPNANPVFRAVLDKFFAGKKDDKTLALIL